MAEEIEVQGLRELHQALQQLPVRMEKNILRGAIRAGARVIYEEARRRAPVLKDADPRRIMGALAKSVRIMSPNLRNGTIKGGVMAGGKATVGRGANKVQANAWYAHFVEYGTVNMPAQPFLRPAVDSRAQTAIEATGQYIRDRLDTDLLK